MAASATSDQLIKSGYCVVKAGRDTVETKEATHFTHLYYAYLQLNDLGELIIQKTLDIEKFIEAVDRADKIPMLSIGGPKQEKPGATDPAVAISGMVNDPVKRKNFIKSSIDFAEKFGFKGIELAWEYPRTEADMTNLEDLFEDWSSEASGSGLLLGLKVYRAPELPTTNAKNNLKYPLTDDFIKCVDIFNIILYNYFPITCAHSQVDSSKTVSVNCTSDAIALWSKTNVPKTKLVMGIPLFGKEWKLAYPSDENKIGSQVIAYNGNISYGEIQNPEGGAFDATTKTMYMTQGDSWYGYDGKRSIKSKIDYLKQEGLGGYFLHAIRDDDDDQTLAKTGTYISLILNVTI
ncbi:hypothetical protein G4B88_019035 [Cannabis sativa]|uniref:GH18 domain-containing protein n=1 Tax=Cannabis sativa TaxID=3483 RepID=A0A7J6H1H3_CANSA|nr:hypothetical protein G4B88_019035 [Cannabis sativa]